MKKEVVILGSSGFVGKNLCQRLEKDFSLIAFSSREIDLISSSSVNQLNDVFNIDRTVVFISALTPDRGRDGSTLVKNIQMAENFSKALESKPCGHLVYVSSDAVYPDGVTPVNEQTLAAPTSFHGVMHLARELILKEVCTKKSIPLTILRPSAIYGAGDTHNSYGPNRFFKTALESGKINLFGEGEEVRDHVFIDDVTSICERVIREKTSGVYNLVSFNAVSFMDVAKNVKDLLASNKAVSIETAKRSGPIVHRHFDGTAFFKTFPNFKPTLFGEGLAKMKQGVLSQ